MARVWLLALTIQISSSNLCDSGFGQFNAYPAIYEYGEYQITITPDRTPGVLTIVGMVDDKQVLENDTPD